MQQELGACPWRGWRALAEEDFHFPDGVSGGRAPHVGRTGPPLQAPGPRLVPLAPLCAPGKQAPPGQSPLLPVTQCRSHACGTQEGPQWEPVKDANSCDP